MLGALEVCGHPDRRDPAPGQQPARQLSGSAVSTLRSCVFLRTVLASLATLILLPEGEGDRWGEAGRDFCVGEGRGDGMKRLGHRTKPGQDLIGSSGLARHSSAPLALLPHSTSHPSVCSSSPTNLSLRASKEVHGGGGVGLDAQPWSRLSMRRLPYAAGDHSCSSPASWAKCLQPRFHFWGLLLQS